MFSDEHIRELVGVGRYQAAAVDYVRPFQIQEGFEYLELLTGGRVIHVEDGREQILGRGALFWEIAGDYSLSRTFRETPYACLTLRFRVEGPARRQVPLVTVLPDRERVRALDHELFHAFHDPQTDRALLCRYAYTRLLWEAVAVSRVTRPQEYPAGLDRLLRELEEEKNLQWTVAEMAAAAGLSEPHLHALFRKHLDTTPHRYLLERRLQRARLLLAGTAQSVKEVSFDCGFANVETFCRCFHRQVGLSPGAYRLRHASRNPG